MSSQWHGPSGATIAKGGWYVKDPGRKLPEVRGRLVR